MLILARRKDESVVIGCGIEIKVLDVKQGKRVRLGILAPDHVDIRRTELLETVSSAPNAGPPPDTDDGV